MTPSYPELTTDFERISAVVRAEEEAFLATLATGSRIFDTAAARPRSRPGATQLPGDKAFQLHDTYGFPIDLTLEMAAEAGLDRRRAGLPHADGRAAQPGQGRRGRAQDRPRRRHGLPRRARRRRAAPTFLGYTDLVGRVAGRRAASSTGSGCRPPVRAPPSRSMLDRTPFYAEGGGQQADTGVIRGDGFVVDVHDVQSPVAGLVVHRGTVARG